jgi:hypothetical protein
MLKQHKERNAETATKTAKSMFGTLCAVLVMSVFPFSSYGESVKAKTLTVANVSISGKLGNYVKVVDGDYILKPVKSVKDVLVGNETGIEIAVKFELVNKYDGYYMSGIDITPVDSKGMEIENDGYRYRFDLVDGGLNELLKGKVGDTAIVLFKWPGTNKDRLKKIMTETTTFSVSSPNDKVE